MLDYRLTLTPSDFLMPYSLPRFLQTHPPHFSMNILSLNVRGAASSDFKRTFRELVNLHLLDIVILTETRVSGQRADNIITNLGFERYTKVDAMGFAGGIWVLWNPNSVCLEPVASSFQEIHLKCKVHNNTFLLSAIYANPLFEHRKSLWESFTDLSSLSNTPWLIMGDLNEISKPFEKFGRGPPSEYKMKIFNTFLNSCNLLDLGFIRTPFTWTNGRLGSQIVRTRIDRIHANFQWLSLFPDSKDFQLPRPRSDHCPILLKTQTFLHSGQKPFRFESM